MAYLSDAVRRNLNTEFRGALANCLFLAQRWSDLRTLLNDPASRPASFPADRLARYETYIDAAQSHKAAAIAKAKALALASPGGSNSVIVQGINFLAVLGLTDDAFELAKRFIPGPPLSGATTTFLFNPLTASLRRDPRFMTLSARLGLVDYWLASGKWPDFCSEPNLPYNCQKEARAAKAAR
jgi:hypothetical protein